MKKIVYLLTLLLFSKVIAQTTIINTPIINTYAAVTEIDFCKNAMRVANNAETLFSVGDRVLIIQMKGISIDNSISPTNGNATDLNEAGSYEFNYVKSINLGSINGLQFENELSYNYSVLGKVQVIKVPQYIDVDIQTTITCLPWDGEKGGIIVFEADGNVTMHANIFLDEMGFRGGGFSNDNDCYTPIGGFQGFTCQSSDNCGGFKGEGTGLSYDYSFKGRGRNGSGAGGGNDHNAGGGGGGNGGNGGNGAANDLNTQFCDGKEGLGGQKNAQSSQKLLMGGGGGAGDSNNNTGTAGGNSGGMLIMKANSLTSNGFVIKSNGQSCATASGDGAGGGGSAGTIALFVNNYTDSLHMELKGGKGGDISDNSNCPAVGGGGSGGSILVNQTSTPGLFSAQLNGGLKGNYLSSLCNGLSLGAQDGESGKVFTSFVPFESTTPFIETELNATDNNLICAGDSALLQAQITSNQNYTLNWLYNNTVVSNQNVWYASPTTRGINQYTAQVLWQVFDTPCKIEESLTILVRNPDIVIVQDPTTPVEIGEPVFMNAVINPPSNLYTYTWNADYIMPNNDRNVVVEPFETTTFCITVTDEIGCVKTACTEVQVILPNAGAPDAFTPNGDGINDLFRIIPEQQLTQTGMTIYNRWGDIMYESNVLFEWDGTLNGKAQNTDVYTWTATFTHKNTGETSTQSGSFTLIR